MIDIKTARASTARFGQYLAYKETVDSIAILDISNTDAIKIKFGIGLMLLIGSFKVQSLVKEIVFHVVYTNTPFLINLQDLNSLNYYYNNLTNKVITFILTVPIT